MASLCCLPLFQLVLRTGGRGAAGAVFFFALQVPMLLLEIALQGSARVHP
jgi:hypothetical protein